MYRYVYGGDGGNEEHYLSLQSAGILALWYCVSLIMSRLYLGAHSPTDIRGGIALGVNVVTVPTALSLSVCVCVCVCVMI